MSLIKRLLSRKNTSASTAKERLQIIISQERTASSSTAPDYLPVLKNELLAVIAKYVHISEDQIDIAMESNDRNSTIALSITLPELPAVPVSEQTTDKKEKNEKSPSKKEETANEKAEEEIIA